MNDHELSKLRFEANKAGISTGFPIWVLRNRYNSILGIYASKQHAEQAKHDIDRYMWVKLDLLYVSDIKHVSYELE